ncbi:hypothetical protein GXP67_12200 [Rhodocytophaga rosea]|uniref:Uncharacterized protein n=1 Tax=Rhodocytophaga rosea TaxID=2704465 RepID=A0A6C0GH16_9BACT|nr:hypothetical protein [Rhodocytophaga rosea]QHT67341.1 hypothetical protein GXP67_12200 [Rhodocytophaga rosea]
MSDGDAKLSEKRGKPSRLYYLSSMAVDTHKHVITHIWRIRSMLPPFEAPDSGK